MVDTGAAPNIIKRRALHPETRIRTDDPLYLSGITSGRIKTLGSAEIELMGHVITVHVVPNNFPIAQEGILGSDFLHDAACIDFIKKCIKWQGIQIPFSARETIIVPARSYTTFYVNVANPEVNTGYLPRLRACENVYIGNALVSNKKGKAYLRAINTGDQDREIAIPTIKLREIEEISRTEPSDEKIKIKAINTVTTHADKASRPERVRNLLRLEHLNREEDEHVRTLIKNHSDLFRLPGDELGCTSAVKHKIVTTETQAVHTRQYRFPPAHKEEINRQVTDLIENKIISPSDSPYSSPLWIVPKKADSKGNKRWRMVVDFRALNEKTLGDAYPLPNITDILDQLGSSKYFSVFDLASGFHQIPMHESDAQKTAFSTPYGHYQFNRMPFGLKNAPATFQRLMDQVLSGLQGTELFVYLDDIVIYSSSLTEHAAKFNKLAERLRKANLKLQPDKCEFLRKEVTYLGHVISETGVKPDPKKIEAVREFPRPRNHKNIKQFLGLAGYYRKFIPDFSKTAKPLTTLLKKDEPFIWSENQENAFTTLRDLLCTEPLLQYPDFTQPFVVTTDASGYAVGGILSQGPIGKDKPIAYASRLLNGAEINYSTIEKELLAMVYCINHFRPYVYGSKFKLVTDHKPLVWLNSVKDPTSRLMRWRLKLAEYEFEVLYKAGKTNVNADALSRNPARTREILAITYTDETSERSRTPNADSEDEPIFEFRPRNSLEIHTGGQNPEPSEGINEQISVSGDATEPEVLIQEIESPTTGSSEDESDSESLFDDPNEPYEPNAGARLRIRETRDNILSRRDNLVIFTTERGCPCDAGSKLLTEAGKLPPIENATLGRARVIPLPNNRFIIALIVKDRISALTEKEIIRETTYSLLDVITELGISNISISQGPVDHVAWAEVFRLIRAVLQNKDVQITICKNIITTPPPQDRELLIKENHASALGGHKGVAKTYNRIKYNHQWPGMKRDVEKYIQNCRNCQLKKLVRRKTKQPMILTDTPDNAFDKISMDIMGPLPTSRSGNSYILTIQDLLTKHSVAIPLKRATALDVAEGFVNEYICVYGAPKALLTDQGTHFINSLMKAVAKRFRITRYKATAYRPQTNGSIERSHHVLWEYLKQIIDDRNNWDEYLKLASFSYNTSVHEGTKHTPHELVFGRIARVPTSETPLDQESNESYTEYLTTLYNKLRDVQAIARDHLIASKERSKKYYDQRINPDKFRIGDKVFLLKEPTHKLGDQYTGPHKIIEILGESNVRLELSPNHTRVVHMNKLRGERRARPPTPPQADAPQRRRLEEDTISIPGTSKRRTCSRS